MAKKQYDFIVYRDGASQVSYDELHCSPRKYPNLREVRKAAKLALKAIDEADFAYIFDYDTGANVETVYAPRYLGSEKKAAS